MVDLVRLQYAVAVAEEKSYAAAAARLGISQPALSRSIQALEREYGIRLFSRGRAGAALTAQGADFITMAHRLLNQAKTVDEQLRMVASSGRVPVSFGIGPISAATAMPHLLPELATDDLTLRIRVEALSTLQLLLRQGDIDFFISGLPVSNNLSRLPDDFRVKRIPLTAINLFVRPGHPLLHGPFERAAMARYPVAAASFVRELLSSARLAQVGLSVPSVEVDDYTMLGALTRNSDFVTVAVRGLSDVRPDLGLVALPVEVTVDDIEYGLVSAGFRDLSSQAQRVATLILEHLAGQIATAVNSSARPPLSNS